MKDLSTIKKTQDYGVSARNSAQILDVWAEMRERYAAGQRLRAEDILQRMPAEALDEQLVVDIVYAEYVLGQEFGVPRDAEQIYRRFPQHRRAIERQLAVHHALSTVDARAVHPPDDARTAPRRHGPSGPTYLGRYLLVSKLGSGGQADVYKAIHPELQKEVVVKVGKPRSENDPLAADRLVSEGRLLAQLEHPHLARVFDLDYAGEQPMLVMEFVRGCTLSQWAPIHRPTPRAAAQLVTKVAQAAAVAHARGIIHRDIKPSNIVVDEAGQPRLIDFGLSHLQDAWTVEQLEQGSLAGTLQYMAPEQARQESTQADPRSDVFSLGAVLYFLLTQRPPFVGDDFRSLYEAVCRGTWDEQPLRCKRIDRRLRAICLRAMATQIDQRYASAEQLAADLQRYAAARRYRSYLLATAAVILLLGVGLWNLLRDPDPRHDRGLPGHSRPPAPEATRVTRGPALQVAVWNADRYLDLHEVAPARTGDQLQITAHVPAGLFASLFLWTSEGQLRSLGRIDATQGAQTLRYPRSAEHAAPLIGPAGTEMLLVCADDERWVSEQELAAALRDKQLALSGAAVLRLNERGVVWESRGRDLGPDVARANPSGQDEQQLAELGRILQNKFPFFEALAFAHAD